MSAVNLRIGHLVIDGLGIESRDRLRLRVAIEAELARLIGAGGDLSALRSQPEVRGEALDVPAPRAPDLRAEAIGTQIGAAIHQSLAR